VKIAISTLHCYNNHGGVIQARCLYRHLTEAGFDCELLDWRETRKRVRSVLLRMVARRPVLDGYLNDLRMSPRFLSRTSAGAADHANRQGGALVVGSDEVWKFNFIPGRPRAWLFPAVPNVYWGENVTVPRIAYAASAGTSAAEEVPEAERPRLAALLRGFRLISVRDRHTEGLVKALCPELNPVLLPDPAFAVPFMEDVDTSRIRARLGLAEKDRFFALAFDAAPPRVEIPTGWRAADLSRLDVDDWLAAIKISDHLVTDRMHAMIMGLLAGKTFELVNPRPKLRELADNFGLPTGPMDDARRNWPHEKIRGRIDEYRQRHRDFAAEMRRVLERTP